MNRRILVTGAKGQLGNEIIQLSNSRKEEFIFTDIDSLNITDIKSIERFIKENPINYIINCAAYTAVDKAENDYDSAFNVNVLAARNLAIIASEHKIDLIHISTDFVFDGRKSVPYKEEDVTNPLSVYGKTKLEGEKEIMGNTNRAIIIRTSWLYSEFGNNFVKTIIRVAKEKRQINVVYDQVGTPTYAKDLASVILKILDQGKVNKSELFHFSNEGVTSWYDFAKIILHITKSGCTVNPIETWQYPTSAKRPSYSVLNKSKIKSNFQVEIPHWTESLRKCLKILEIK